MADLVALVDRLTVRVHEAERRNVYEWSGSISQDLAALRADVDAIRAEAGLPPSPLEPAYPEEEVTDQ